VSMQDMSGQRHKLSNDQETSVSPASDESERQSSGSQPSNRSRLPRLSLPIPNPHRPAPARVPGAVFEMSTSDSSSGNNNMRQSLPRSPEDTSTLNRLPSIRPDGMLVEDSVFRIEARALYAYSSDSTSFSNVRSEGSPPRGDR